MKTFLEGVLLVEGSGHPSAPLALGQDHEAVLVERVHDGEGVVLGLRAARPETAPAPGR